MAEARSKLEQKEIKQDGTTNSSSLPSSVGLFSLKEICMHEFLSKEHQIDEKHIGQLFEANLLNEEYNQFKQEKLKHGHETVTQANPDAACEMADAYPTLLLEESDEKEVVITRSTQKSAKKTLYQMALAEEDFQLAAKLEAKLVSLAGEKEAAAQFNKQFPKDWEVDEQKRWQPLFDQLNTLTQAIRTANPGDIVSSGDPEYKLTIREGSAVALALAQYRALWDSILNEVVTTGRHYNPKLLQQAFQIYDDHYEDYFGNDWNDPRAMCFWQQVIGYAERLMPANYVQALCDGLYNTAEKLQKGVSQGRSFKFEVYDSARRGWCMADFYPLAASRLGFDFAIYGGGYGAGRELAAGGAPACVFAWATAGAGGFSKLMSIKNSRLTELMHRYQNGPSKATRSCVTM